jgi:phosphoglycolate phosphatase
MGCVTNKAGCFTEPLLADLGIIDKFSVVISGDTLSRKKPDPAQLLYAAEYFGVKPEDALMVGDSVNDVQAARAAAFQVVCVSYGYNHGQDIRDANPDMVIDSMVELGSIMEQAA